MGSSNTGADDSSGQGTSPPTPTSELTPLEHYEVQIREMEIELARLKASLGVQTQPRYSKLAAFK